MYDAVADPYCYDGTTVLKNIPGLRTQELLDTFEAAAATQRADEPLPAGHLSVRHYRAMHRHLFQDVYGWAGKFRTVRLSKNGSAFCYPEHIAREMKKAFAGLKARHFLGNLSTGQFAGEAAQFLSTLNAIHPFREGNGRTQILFLILIAAQARHPLNLDRLEAIAFMNAMVQSFRSNLAPLVDQICELAT